MAWGWAFPGVFGRKDVLLWCTLGPCNPSRTTQPRNTLPLQLAMTPRGTYSKGLHHDDMTAIVLKLSQKGTEPLSP